MKSGADTPSQNGRTQSESEGQFVSGAGKGVHLKAMRPYYEWVLRHLVKRAELHNGEALLPRNGRPVVVFTAHGPGFAWLPILALAGKYCVENGHGETVGGMYPHKAVFWVPGLKAYYKRYLGTPTEINTVDDLTTQLKSRDITITGTAPEGANNLLSYEEYVGPFRSRGMIAAAIRAGGDLCLIAHQGADEWNFRVNLPFGLRAPNAYGLRGVNIPLPPYKKLDCYIALCRRYEPEMTASDFETLGKREIQLRLRIEAERMRMEMNLMTDEVKSLMNSRKLQKMLRHGR